MKSILTALSCLLAVGLTGPVQAAPCPEVTEQLVSAPDVTTWPPAPYRWRDIATNLYAQAYQDDYSYDDALVTVTYAPCECLAFAGHLSAANLKPNFAYQIKLVGKPTGLWGAEGDDAANELIGFIGRWWRTQPNTGNSSDADYIANHDNPAYIFEGYLVLDFFITDPDGSAEVDFAVDSSFHVLWWQHQRTPGSCDSPVKWATVTGSTGDPAYDTDVGPEDIGVFAEIERLCYGETVMTPGSYNCRLLLTEESFHQSGDGNGYWASAVAFDNLRFEVVDSLSGAPVQPAATGLLRIHPNPFNPLTTIKYAVPSAGRVTLTVFDIRGHAVRTLVDTDQAPGFHDTTWDGRDRTGKALASGVYFVRLATGEGVSTGKLVLSK